MSNLLNARAGLSADMAIRFEKAFEVEADTLLRMQAAHDLAKARAHEDAIRVAFRQGGVIPPPFRERIVARQVIRNLLKR